ALVLHEHLCLVLEAAERGRVHDAIAIARVAAARGALVFRIKTPATLRRLGCEWRARRRRELRTEEMFSRPSQRCRSACRHSSAVRTALSAAGTRARRSSRAPATKLL